MDGDAETNRQSAVARAEHRAELQTTTLLKVEQLTETVESNAAQVAMLRHDVAGVSEARRWRSRMLWVVTAVVTGLAAVAPFILVQQHENHRALARLQALNQTLIECTTPDNPKADARHASDRVHECFDQQRLQRDEFLQQLTDNLTEKLRHP